MTNLDYLFMDYGKIYLIPTNIGDGAVYDEMPEINGRIINQLDYFIVENIRSARRFLSKAGIEKPIDSLEFIELNEHTVLEDIAPMLKPIMSGRSAGVLSEAGLPAIADPGADIVAAAQNIGIECIPLVGPSSIFMALMASGMNGQSFAFNGYLPVKQSDRANAIRRFEKRAITESQSQIFIEAPYRNVKLIADFLSVLSGTTRLTIAADILSKNQYIRTLSVAEWRQTKLPELNKRPAIFIVGGNRNH
jgi:16S rRNA (cytidine1402-2'-O)-methyltransferase